MIVIMVIMAVMMMMVVSIYSCDNDRDHGDIGDNDDGSYGESNDDDVNETMTCREVVPALLSNRSNHSSLHLPSKETQLQFYAHLIEHLSSRGADSNRLSEIFHPILEGLLKEVNGYKELMGSMEVQLFRFPSALFFFARNSSLASVSLPFHWHCQHHQHHHYH